MSKYKSPFSVDHRNPIIISSRDPRVNKKNIHEYISKSGRKVIVKEDKQNKINIKKDTNGWMSHIDSFDNYTNSNEKFRNDSLHSIVRISNNEYIYTMGKLEGNTSNSTNSLISNDILFKYNKDGKLIWKKIISLSKKTFKDIYGDYRGAIGRVPYLKYKWNMYASNISVDPNDNVYVVGGVYTTFQIPTAYSNWIYQYNPEQYLQEGVGHVAQTTYLFIIKYNKDGKVMWTKYIKENHKIDNKEFIENIHKYDGNDVSAQTESSGKDTGSGFITPFIAGDGYYYYYPFPSVLETTSEIAYSGESCLRVTWSSGQYEFPNIVCTISPKNRFTEQDIVNYEISVKVYVPSGSPDVCLSIGYGHVNPQYYEYPTPFVTTSLKDQWVTLTLNVNSDEFYGQMSGGSKGMVRIEKIVVNPYQNFDAGAVYIDNFRVRMYANSWHVSRYVTQMMSTYTFERYKAESIIIQKDGSIYLTGIFAAFNNYDSSDETWNEKNFLLKLNSNGKIIWQKTFIDYYAITMTLDNDDNIYLIKAGQNNDLGSAIKIASNGKIIGKYSFDATDPNFNNPAYGLPNFVTFKIDSNGYICGFFEQKSIYNDHVLHYVLFKYDPTTNKVISARRHTANSPGDGIGGTFTGFDIDGERMFFTDFNGAIYKFYPSLKLDTKLYCYDPAVSGPYIYIKNKKTGNYYILEDNYYVYYRDFSSRITPTRFYSMKIFNGNLYGVGITSPNDYGSQHGSNYNFNYSNPKWITSDTTALVAKISINSIVPDYGAPNNYFFTTDVEGRGTTQINCFLDLAHTYYFGTFKHKSSLMSTEAPVTVLFNDDVQFEKGIMKMVSATSINLNASGPGNSIVGTIKR